MQLTDAQRRGMRTAVQVIVGLLITGLIGYLTKIDVSHGIPDLNALKTGLVGVGISVLVGFLGWAQNHGEDMGWFPAYGKAPASAGANPAPPTGPAVPADSPPQRTTGGPTP